MKCQRRYRYGRGVVSRHPRQAEICKSARLIPEPTPISITAARRLTKIRDQSSGQEPSHILVGTRRGPTSR
jgi:hypothetical protein